MAVKKRKKNKKNKSKNKKRKSRKSITIKYDASCAFCNKFVIRVIGWMKGVNYSLQPLTKKEIKKMNSWRVKIGRREYFRGKAFLKLMCQKYKFFCWVFKSKFLSDTADKFYDMISRNKHCPIIEKVK